MCRDPGVRASAGPPLPDRIPRRLQLGVLAANLPLLESGLLPLSYVDVDKAEYLRGMVAVYELGSTRMIERTFIRAYATSVARAG